MLATHHVGEKNILQPVWKKGALGNSFTKTDFCKALTYSCQRREQVGCFTFVKKW